MTQCKQPPAATKMCVCGDYQHVFIANPKQLYHVSYYEEH